MTKIETKVQASSWAALVATPLVALLVKKAPVLTDFAEPLQALIIGLLSAAAALAAGWYAKHTDRPDLAPPEA